MAGGFGRKSVGAGMPGGTVAAPAEGLSPAARAFLAAERARQPERVAERAPDVAAPARAAASAFHLAPNKPRHERSLWIAYLLWWFASPLAAHRFYLGAYKSASAMFALFWGGLAIAAVTSKQSSVWIGGYAMPPPGIAMVLTWLLWALVDVFLIPGVRRRHSEAGQERDLSAVFA